MSIGRRLQAKQTKLRQQAHCDCVLCQTGKTGEPRNQALTIGAVENQLRLKRDEQQTRGHQNQHCVSCGLHGPVALNASRHHSGEADHQRVRVVV